MIDKKALEEYFRIYKPEENANNCCFICKKCVDGCSWSRDAEPIKGWKAATVARSGYYQQDTYKIFYCPEFEEGDASKDREYDEEKCMGMLEAIYKSAAEDYKSAYKRKLKLERQNTPFCQNEIEIAESMMRECSFLLGKWTEKLKAIVEKEMKLEEGDADG
jgi:hypothetical protein